MKKFYSVWAMLAMMFMALNFTACSKDSDDGGDIDDSSIVGTWQTMGEEYGNYGLELTKIDSDGTFVRVYDDGETDISYGSWTLSNNVLTLKVISGDWYGDTWVYTVLKKSSSTMVLDVEGFPTTLKKVSDSTINKYLN